MKSKKFFLLLVLGIFAVLWAPTEAKAVVMVNDAPNTATNQVHQATSLWGHLTEWGQWLDERVRDMNNLAELIENNFLTKAIRGFNELMTAIQTDISDVLGTVETLMAAPLDILGDLMEIPNSLFGILEQVQGAAGGFMGIYEEATGIFDMLANSQALGEDVGNMFEGTGGAYGFYNQVSGLNTRLNSQVLRNSRTNSQRTRQWNKALYGGDSVQIQSTSLDVLTHLYQQAIADQEMQAAWRLREASKEAAALEGQRTRTGRTMTMTINNISGQLY